MKGKLALMDQVKIKAVVAAGGLAKNAEVTVAATPLVEGAIRNGVFQELERHPAEPVDVESDPLDVPPFDEPEVTPKPGDRRRSRG